MMLGLVGKRLRLNNGDCVRGFEGSLDDGLEEVEKKKMEAYLKLHFQRISHVLIIDTLWRV